MTFPGKAIIVIVVAVVVVAALGAYGLVGGASGAVSIYVKDAPESWAHVNVTFSEVQIHKASARNDSGWHSLSIKNGTVDLVALTNASSLLASSNVPAGMYTQIRIVVSSATGVMSNGTEVAFTVPSGELKTTHPFNVTAGQTDRITLEIDLERSIVHTSQGWLFTPVLGSVSETDVGSSGYAIRD